MPEARAQPVLWLLTGINGAGKSTFFDQFLRPRLALPFVNADVLARERWPRAYARHAYEAGRIAEQQRRQLIAEGRSLIAETVFSHPSKLTLIEDARAAGHRVHLIYIHVPLPLAIRRVATRVALGGHDVPEEKLHKRYTRVIANLHAALPRVERAWLYDNSRADRLHAHVATFEQGRVTRIGRAPPRWLRQLFPALALRR